MSEKYLLWRRLGEEIFLQLIRDQRGTYVWAEQENGQWQAAAKDQAPVTSEIPGLNLSWTHFECPQVIRECKFDRCFMQASLASHSFFHFRATHNLFQLVNRHQKQASDVPVEETNDQLNRIQQFIQDLTQITTEIKRSEALAQSTAGASSS
jgi:hypothetical protein